jgi:hypothetical protein
MADKQTNLAVLVRVSDVNDNSPIFSNAVYNATVNELDAIGSTVFAGLEATDADSGQNALVEYFTVPGDRGVVSISLSLSLSLSLFCPFAPHVLMIRWSVRCQHDGYDKFEIRYPHQGLVTLKSALDYEFNRFYDLDVIAVVSALLLTLHYHPAHPHPHHHHHHPRQTVV